ncbi:glycosyltransferase family 4 protein [Acaryochloris marina NIES-2412]|uniref:glycosyltransferase family 4 protein n=1 Tax=Acaryochloris marina TaxID=155978 RepID=UPI004058417F
MKVLHINQIDFLGGAAIAANRLHQGLRKQGIDSQLLVDTVSADSDFVSRIVRNRFAENMTSRFTSLFGLKYINLSSTFSIPDHPDFQAANVINFHNLHGNYFNYLALPKLTNRKPAILTLHDMWSFTGHCSYSFDCDRWKHGCGNCPYLETYPSISRDSTKIEWKLKHWSHSKSNLVVAAPSRWLEQQARESILNMHEIQHIPYGIDTHIYRPIENDLCRSILDISPRKKILMFGAQSLKDSRKGGDLLLKILQMIPTTLSKDIVLLTIGSGGEKISKSVDMPVINIGYLSSDYLKAMIYSVADIFLFPTRADNLPLTLMESLSCGTPIISFDVGGVPDLVHHGKTGYLAKSENIEDFSNYIIRLLEDRSTQENMSTQCRNLANSEFSLDIQTKRYIDLYKKIMIKN